VVLLAFHYVGAHHVVFTSGYTINRVTLFALIFSIGILVMTLLSGRKHGGHFRLPENHGRPMSVVQWKRCRGWQSDHFGNLAVIGAYCQWPSSAA